MLIFDRKLNNEVSMLKYVKKEVMEWTQHLQNVCGVFETSFDGQDSLFIGEVESYLLGQTEVAFIKSNANVIVRKKGVPDRVKDRFCFLILQHTGKISIEYTDESLTLCEGDIILLDPEETISMFPHGLFSHISVHLSREKLFKHGISHEHFGKLMTNNMSGHLLKNMLKAMSPENIHLWYSEEDGNAFEEALIALIKPTINYKSIQSFDRLRAKAERFIIENLAQPNLSPQLIADHVGISLRHLYRLFIDEKQSINKYIQFKRLEEIQRELKDLKNSKLSITHIALKWGFWDSAHFSKIFKKTYGISPRAFRETVGEYP